MSRANFIAALRERLGAEPWLKGCGIPAFMGLFFECYFATLRHPLRAAVIMPPGVIDRWIGYHPATVPIYCSLWAYAVLPPSLARTRSELLRVGAAAALLAVAGLSVFLAWPTAVATVGTGFLKRVDLGGNAFPSLHAAYTVFSALCLRRILTEMRAPAIASRLSLAWAGAILYATLATKQHVLTDVLAGALLGAGAAQFFSSSRSNDPPSPASSAARR